jgi:hypothetical protein
MAAFRKHVRATVYALLAALLIAQALQDGSGKSTSADDVEISAARRLPPTPTAEDALY